MASFFNSRDFLRFTNRNVQMQWTKAKARSREKQSKTKAYVFVQSDTVREREREREREAMEAPKRCFEILLLLLLLVSANPNAFIHRALAEGVTPEEAKQLRDEVTRRSYFP